MNEWLSFHITYFRNIDARLPLGRFDNTNAQSDITISCNLLGSISAHSNANSDSRRSVTCLEFWKHMYGLMVIIMASHTRANYIMNDLIFHIKY